MGDKGERPTEQELELKKRHDFLRFRRDLLCERVKEAFATAIFSYQFFEQDRQYYCKLNQKYRQLDLELAEVDGRLQKCKPKLEPRSRQRKLPVVTKDKLKEVLATMSPENKQQLYQQLLKEVEDNS